MKSGIINFYKPVGMSSHTAANKVRIILGAEKGGHTGTLDPYAEGVLPILIGSATRFSELLVEGEKKYIATLHLGHTTTTLDGEGEDLTYLSRGEVFVTRQQVEEVLPRFKGEILQEPPMYSAVSVDGVRLYKLAREGVEVKREKRAVTVFDIHLVEFDEEDFYVTISVTCSKGTYIRTLAADIGQALGCGAMLAGLVRAETGGFSIEDALTAEQLEQLGESALIPIESRFLHLQKFTPAAFYLRLLQDGQRVERKKLGLRDMQDGQMLRLYEHGDNFLGIARAVTHNGAPCLEFFKRI